MNTIQPPQRKRWVNTLADHTLIEARRAQACAFLSYVDWNSGFRALGKRQTDIIAASLATETDYARREELTAQLALARLNASLPPRYSTWSLPAPPTKVSLEPLTPLTWRVE